MKHYDIKIVNDDFDWNDIPVIDIDYPYFDTPDNIKAYSQICADTSGLNVHLWTVEDTTRAAENGALAFPSEDSCLEFFFCPMENDKRYFNIEFNFNGALYLGYGSDISSLVRLVNVDNSQVIKPTAKKLDNGWEIYYKVTYEFIRRFYPDFKVYDGKEIKANVYKCQEEGDNIHFLSWSPIIGEPFTFHRPECLGTMKFVN